MNKKRKIAIFTGNRAEYGLQYPILKAIGSDPRLEYYLLVGGAHLQENFGKTMAEINEDGFQVYSQVEIEMQKDTLFSTAQAIGTGILSLSRILDNLKPDFLVVYADRFEGFSAVITGTQMNIPTAHIEGGDYTEGGALDDSVRHAMTKLAHLHFATNDQAAERILKLGEEPWRVFTVGFPALDLVAEGKYASPDDLCKFLDLDPQKPIILFCQHSVTTEFDRSLEQIRPSLQALYQVAQEGYQVVITYPNNDAGGQRIIEEIRDFISKNHPNIQAIKSLGRFRFHGLLNLMGRIGKGVLVGNSSAGIKETPAFGCPCVNIGTRQQGRLRADNVVDVSYDTMAIYHAIKHSIEDDDYRINCAICKNPYGAGNAGPRISEVLATLPIDNRLLQKKMTY